MTSDGRTATLLRTRVPRTLSALEDVLADRAPGETVHAWLFEPAAARRAAEAGLAAIGVRAVFHSAYKPLVHAFLEEIDLGDVVAIDVGYPVIAGVPRSRFLLECYPLDALVGGRSLSFHAVETEERRSIGSSGPPPLRYAVTLRTSSGEARVVDVPAPNRRVDTVAGERVLGNCGWHEGPLVTDLERAFELAIACIGRHPWPLAEGGPFFERLSITLTGPFADEPLPLGSECVSLAEAMHEELYFSGLETFARLLDLPEGSRELCPGQIVPIVRAVPDGDWQLSVALERAPPESAAEGRGEVDVPVLALAERWLTPRDIDVHLETLGGEAFSRRSRQGRAVNARHVRADRGDAGGAVFISAGRHANETSGPVGVLRAAHDLKAAGVTEFVVAPLMNPDGYALFRECCGDHAGHLHHAARYSAFGNDPECGDDALEHGIRVEGRARTGASLHVDCHGYPSHEWTRPFSGYLPRGFASWTLPKGFFLIMRHAPGLRERAHRIVDACVAALNGFAPVMAINAEQLERHARYAVGGGLEIRSGVPVLVTEVVDALFPMTLITEAPDETVYGERFRVLHEAQRRVVLAAVVAAADLERCAPPSTR